MFSESVQEALGWYVYALRDPSDKRVFYVGKGRGNRVFEHAHHALSVEDEEGVSQKIALIQQIHARGDEVDAFVLRHGIPSEQAAYEIEAAVIDTLRLLDPTLDNDLFGLTNLVLGHHHALKGLSSAQQVVALYEAPAAPPITVPAILVKIPQQWTPTLSGEQIYETTRQWWVIGPKRDRARYAFAVNRGIVREVYAIEAWEPGSWDEEANRWVTPPVPGQKVRWRFTGRPAADLAHFRHTSVKELVAKTQNPIRYLNV